MDSTSNTRLELRTLITDLLSLSGEKIASVHADYWRAALETAKRLTRRK